MEIEIANDVRVTNLRSVNKVNENGDLPYWLLLEFLIRLPQKVVFRLKLVSKQWLSIISEPYFVRTYCSRALTLQKLQPWVLVPTFRKFSVNENIHLPDLDLLVDAYSSNLKWPYCYALSLPCLPIPHEKEYIIYAVSNGLVLYGPERLTEGGNEFRICNYVTGQCITLPSNDNLQNHANWGLMTKVEDGVLISYTVACLNIFNNQSKFITCDVYISQVDEWKKYIVPYDIYIRVASMSNCAVFNGVMHWMLSKWGLLIAYDPHKHPDRIRFIPRPGEANTSVTCHIFAAYQGQLRYSESSFMHDGSHELYRRYRIWVLKDYGSGDWCLQHQVNTYDIQNLTTLRGLSLVVLNPVSFHPYDSNIVYFVVDEKMFYIYNIKTRKLEVSEEFRLIRGKRLSFLSMHLLSIPTWPVSFSHPSVSSSED